MVLAYLEGEDKDGRRTADLVEAAGRKAIAVPLVSTADDLSRALRSPAVVPERYAAFRERYCYLEDGHATDRLVARLGLDATSEGFTRRRSRAGSVGRARLRPG